ncbi:MAG TPA: ADOP family duplicated permease, partial [Vicinamibacterales bacterium]|nr:ADOP family duplicated permease [Vicinamibacterales bacterium]
TELKATVIGVMPADFVFRTRDIDFWTPFDFTPAEAANRTSHFLTVVARLAPGVSVDQARDEMTAIAARQARTYPDSNDGLGIAVVPVVEEFLGAARLQVIVLACAALCVLLIACANLANLVLSRSIARRAELRMRAALGASRARLVQQMLVEGVVLSVIGGLVGLAAAPIGAAAIERLVPTTVAAPPSEVTTGLLLFAAGLSMLTGIAFSLLPAVYAARHSAAGVAGRSSRVTSDARSRMAREALVVVQVAVALVLLVGAGLLLRTLANLRAIDVGFRTDHLLTMRTTLPRTKYQDPSRRLEFYERVIDGVRQTAGVQNAAYASTLPFVSRGNTNGYLVDSDLSPGGTVQGQAALVNKNDALYRVATANYLQTLGVRLVEGRLFEPSDGADSPKVVIVNETFARRHWPTGSALGHRVSFGDETGPWRTIVGVVRDVRESGYLPMMKPGAYLPYAQVLDTWALPEYLIVRTTVAPETVASSLRSIVSRVDSDQAMTSVRTMEEIIDVDVADREQQATLIAAFSLAAIVLAALGLYGVLAHLVTQRRREIGVRMALGATRASIVLSVVRHGLLLSLAGLVAGLALSALLARLLTTLLYQVGQNDLVTHIGVVTILAAVAFFASAIPALRASSVDPMQVLRQE